MLKELTKLGYSNKKYLKNIAPNLLMIPLLTGPVFPGFFLRKSHSLKISLKLLFSLKIMNQSPNLLKFGGRALSSHLLACSFAKFLWVDRPYVH